LTLFLSIIPPLTQSGRAVNDAPSTIDNAENERELAEVEQNGGQVDSPGN
jgi:hypothetical protein